MSQDAAAVLKLGVYVPSEFILKMLAIARGRRWFVRAGLVLRLGFLLPGLLPAQASRHPAAAADDLAASSAKSGPTVLRTIRQVRNLSASQAAGSVPVRVRGIVTVIPGWRNSFFLQDATAGISVDRTDHAEVRLGDRVEVAGVSNPGLFAPLVMASRVVVTGRGAPPPVRPVAYAELEAGAQDSQWIEVSGVVQSSRAGKLFGRDVLMLTFAVGGGSLSVTLQDIAGIDPDSLTDSTLRLRGVAVTAHNEKRQFVGVGLVVPQKSDVEVIQAADRDPFAGPATPVRDLFQFGQSPHRLKVRGVATYQVPGRALYMQDGRDGIMIQTDSKELVPPGALVEAVGFPLSGDYAPRLADGLLRIAGTGPPVAPPRIRARDAMAITGQPDVDPPPYDEQLVRIEGAVVQTHGDAGQLVWTMRQGDQLFEARMAAADRLKRIGVGSVLALTGICEVHLDVDHVPVSFSLLLRTPDDVVVITRSPWWTPDRVLLAIDSLAFLVVAAGVWVAVLRHQVERQTRIIRQSETRFRYLAERDQLTGLPNRLRLEERIAQILDRCRADKLRGALFSVDIDRFKHINDTYGHLVGDECLKIVATRLRGVVRQADTIARTGGEEFTIVVGGLADTENARRISDAILDLFQKPLALPDRELKITVSVGGALYPDDAEDSEGLRKRSDQALYEAKRTGRNRALFATEALFAANQLSAAIEGALREGRGLNSFALRYQPIVDATGAIRRFEALLRSTDERLSGIGPAQFIPVAEESGLVIPLGRWVMEQACRQIVEWRALGAYERPIAVNISGKELTHPGFADQVARTLRKFHVEPAMIELEIAETTAMALMPAAAGAIATLAAAGVAFAIDDFGTGYSSLSRLHELSIRTIKIDRSFVNLIEKGGGSSALIKAIIQMARNLGISVVAEGVETGEQFDLLRALGCDYFQGYLFAWPLTPDRALEALSENDSRILPVSHQALGTPSKQGSGHRK